MCREWIRATKNKGEVFGNKARVLKKGNRHTVTRKNSSNPVHGLLYGCSWVAHGLLMGLSWDALCELYLQGHEFAMIIACDHRDFCLSAIGQPYDDNMPLFCNNTMLFGNNGMFSDS